ncbi:hypothetical protein CYLTODRAFT_493469 [Cylindrobasidium torrendii FP15055 ss-10]|uniref:Uncharacterized protein n=1 Tax=Cylindrobasidium torrendii FP15055 ss-10 TaxID=1314674 RepID=A0A0D7B3C0_9AGAR|nr:hypothetical protein CYLTODRAFT_493469 [Cylindrobasidium torrendii FP15055 ss-10]
MVAASRDEEAMPTTADSQRALEPPCSHSKHICQMRQLNFSSNVPVNKTGLFARLTYAWVPGQDSGRSLSHSNQSVSHRHDAEGGATQRRLRFDNDDDDARYRQDAQTVESFGPVGYRNTATTRNAQPPLPPSVSSVHQPSSSRTQTAYSQRSEHSSSTIAQTSRPALSQSTPRERYAETRVWQQPVSSSPSQGPVYAQDRAYSDQDNSYPVAGPSRIQATAHDAQRRHGGIWPDIYGQSSQSQTSSRHGSNTSRMKAPDGAGRAYGS